MTLTFLFPFASDEFLSQLLFRVPDGLAIPTPTPTSTSASEQAPVLISSQAPLPPLACYWVSQDDPPRLCGASLSPDPKLACEHFRIAHNVRGNDKAIVGCHWHACNATPMQRGSLIRHLLTIHLGLLRWQCQVCGRVFSRKWTGHTCVGA